MPKVQVERLGGLAGFGGARSHLRSRGELDTARLSAADQRAVEGLFQSHGTGAPAPVPDGFRYRLSRPGPGGVESVEIPEQHVPEALRQCVRDEFA